MGLLGMGATGQGLDRSIIRQLPLTIASGASLSGAVALNGYLVVGILMPTTWTAAALTFSVALAASATYVPLVKDDTAEKTLQAAGGQYLAIDPNLFAGVLFVKVRSGTTGTPVTQGQDSIVTLVVRAP